MHTCQHCCCTPAVSFLFKERKRDKPHVSCCSEFSSLQVSEKMPELLICFVIFKLFKRTLIFCLPSSFQLRINIRLQWFSNYTCKITLLILLMSQSLSHNFSLSLFALVTFRAQNSKSFLFSIQVHEHRVLLPVSLCSFKFTQLPPDCKSPPTKKSHLVSWFSLTHSAYKAPH